MKRQTIYLIDADVADEEGARLMQTMLDEYCPGYDWRLFGSIFDATKEPPPDGLIVDVGNIACGTPQPELAVRCCAAVMRRFDAATTFVVSAVGGWADDTAQELTSELGLTAIPLDSDYEQWAGMLRKYGLEPAGSVRQ